MKKILLSLVICARILSAHAENPTSAGSERKPITQVTAEEIAACDNDIISFLAEDGTRAFYLLCEGELEWVQWAFPPLEAGSDLALSPRAGAMQKGSIEGLYSGQSYDLPQEHQFHVATRWSQDQLVNLKDSKETFEVFKQRFLEAVVSGKLYNGVAIKQIEKARVEECFYYDCGPIQDFKGTIKGSLVSLENGTIYRVNAPLFAEEKYKNFK